MLIINEVSQVCHTFLNTLVLDVSCLKNKKNRRPISRILFS